MTDTTVLDSLPDDVKSDFVLLRALPDGRVIGVRRLMYTWSLMIDIDWAGYATRYCYERFDQAVLGFLDWDGKGDPPGGWHRNPDTGRRRPNGDPAQEYIAW